MPTECPQCGEPLEKPAFLCDECRDTQDSRWKKVQGELERKMQRLRNKMNLWLHH